MRYVNIVRTWIRKHTKQSIIIAIALACFIGFSVARCSVVQSDKIAEKQQAEDNISHATFTSDQQSLLDSYTDKEREVVEFLANSKWVDNTGAKALFMTDHDFIERYNEKETLESFAICTIDEESEKVNSVYVQKVYRLSVLTSTNDYKNLTLTKLMDADSSSAGVITANLEADKLFSNASIYNRISNLDSFSINNWDNNANQFINNHYDELQTCIKDYCAKFYPQVSSVDWSQLVTIDYTAHNITLPFTFKTKSYYTLNIVYSQDTGTFECQKAKSGA